MSQFEKSELSVNIKEIKSPYIIKNLFSFL